MYGAKNFYLLQTITFLQSNKYPTEKNNFFFFVQKSINFLVSICYFFLENFIWLNVIKVKFLLKHGLNVLELGWVIIMEENLSVT